MQGVSGENLLRLMELRMDNVVYRMGFATSRPQARQLVSHGHFLLNGRKHNIPSAILRQGDVITVKEKSRNLEPIVDAVENVVAVPNDAVKEDEARTTPMPTPLPTEEGAP